MEKYISQIKIADLSDDSYIIKFPREMLDEGYTSCNALVGQVCHAFPRKEFVWIPADLEIIKGNDEAIDFLIEELTKLKGDRNEQPGRNDNESVEKG